MAVEIKMPQLSDTMDQGTILSWSKQEGDAVEVGDELAEVGTDKADLPIEAFDAGVLLKIYAKEGDTVLVGAPIGVIGEAGEAIPEPSSAPAAAAPKAAEPAPVAATPAAQPAAQAAAVTPAPVTTAPAPQAVANGQNGARIKISPLAKNLALSQGVDITGLKGSGEGGRIVKRDIEQAMGGATGAAPAPAAPARAAVLPTPAGGHSIQPLSKMRQAIASRMVEAVTTIPHFYLTTAIEVDALKQTRASLKELAQYEGVTFNHFIVRAAALALRKVPRINAFYQESNMVQPADINIGIITAVEDGLLIPVLKCADQLPLIDTVSEANGLVQRARSGRPKSNDLMGATFCISNVGRFAVESFTAVISPGNGAILAVGAIAEEAVSEAGTIRSANVMRVTLSVDHRIIDGVMGAEFLTELKRLIEDPVLLLA